MICFSRVDMEVCYTVGNNESEIECWLLDTRTLWQGQSVIELADAMKARSLISAEECDIVGKKLSPLDAKMSLASALMKRLYISQALKVQWQDVHLSKQKGKPHAVDHRGAPIAGIDFNVSHQNGLVALVGRKPVQSNEKTLVVGVDITCVNERNDHHRIKEKGIDRWIDAYASVFSPEERDILRHGIGEEGAVKSRRCGEIYPRNIGFILRCFYTYFCCKEAYTKLNGEGLAVTWLPHLNFSGLRPPKPAEQIQQTSRGLWGERLERVGIFVQGEEVKDARIDVQAFEDQYILAIAIRGDILNVEVPRFRHLDFDVDIPAAPGKDNTYHH